MATSHKQWMSAEIFDDKKLSRDELKYFENRSQKAAHGIILAAYQGLLRDNPGLTKHQIAVRLGKSDEQINRWLARPSNLTVKKLGVLLAAMGFRPKYTAEKLSTVKRATTHHSDVILKTPTESNSFDLNKLYFSNSSSQITSTGVNIKFDIGRKRNEESYILEHVR